MTLATIAAFGVAVWQGFFAGLGFTRAVILEQGALGYDKVQSFFAALRLLDAPVALAYTVQAIVSAGTIAALVIVWRGRADARLKAAALLVASLIATPYVLDYDMVLLAPALAFALSYGLEKGFDPYEKSGLALVWALPLFARPLGGLGLPLGALVMLVASVVSKTIVTGLLIPIGIVTALVGLPVFFVLVLRRSGRER